MKLTYIITIHTNQDSIDVMQEENTIQEMSELLAGQIFDDLTDGGYYIHQVDCEWKIE
jgi:hypothetical protein